MDSAFNRNSVAGEWGVKLDQLRNADPDGYKHQVVIHDGMGHWMQRNDAVALPWMAKFTRNPHPQKIVWHQSGVTHDRFYWLAVEPGKPKPGSTIIARIEDQNIILESVEQVEHVRILLNDRLFNLDKPISVKKKKDRQV